VSPRPVPHTKHYLACLILHLARDVFLPPPSSNSFPLDSILFLNSPRVPRAGQLGHLSHLVLNFSLSLFLPLTVTIFCTLCHGLSQTGNAVSQLCVRQFRLGFFPFSVGGSPSSELDAHPEDRHRGTFIRFLFRWSPNPFSHLYQIPNKLPPIPKRET